MGKEGDENSLPVVKKDLCSVAQRSHSLSSLSQLLTRLGKSDAPNAISPEGQRLLPAVDCVVVSE